MSTRDPRHLSGPVVPPASGGDARQLVVFLHGWGSSGDDLIQLAPYFSRHLPDAGFFAPHAPERCNANPAGFQWFSLESGLEGKGEGVALAATDIATFIDETLSRFGIGPDRLALIGFSQGAAMALEVGLARPLAGIVAYSGALLPSASSQGDAEVLLVHGAADDVVPVENLHGALARLGPMGSKVRFSVRPNLGHSIDSEGMALAANFLRQRLLTT